MIKTEAIVLKAADLGEADRLLTTYTKEFGKIQIAARGIKKAESKLRYHLEPLSYIFLILVNGKNLKIVKDAVSKDQFLSMRKDLERMEVAYKIVDLINELIVGEEKDEGIWNLTLQTFKNLNVEDKTIDVVKNFQDNLLRLLGYEPEFVKNLKDIY
jgi:DNA repair protein RecO (recombination protein O)